MTVYIIGRSFDSFVIYPWGHPEQIVLCEDVDALWRYVVDETDEDDKYALTPEAAELLR